MELSVTGRLKRAAQTARPQVQKAPEEKTRVQQHDHLEDTAGQHDRNDRCHTFTYMIE